MKLILTGATGAAGLEVLRAAIADPAISRVTVLSRRPLPVSIPTSPKAHVITHEDFSSYPADLISKVADHDACIWALGKSSNGMSETDYTQLTHDWPMAAITALKDGGVGSAEKPFRFVYFSGEGADQTEKSMAMFGRIKGRTEKDLIAYANASGVMKAQMLRPAYFFPAHADDRQQLRGGVARIFDKIATPLLSTLAPSFIVPIQELGKIAVEIAKGAYGDDEVFRNTHMKELIKKSKGEL